MVKPSKCSFTNFLVSVYLVSGGRVLVLLDTGESSLSPPCAHKQKHSSTYKRGWLAALNVECLVFKVTGSIQGSELPISVCFIEIGWCCIPEGEHLILAVAEWNWICEERREWVEWPEKDFGRLHVRARAHTQKMFLCHCGTDGISSKLWRLLRKHFYPSVLHHLTYMDPLTHTHTLTQSSSWLLRSYSPWQSSSVLEEQMIVSLDSE